MNEVEDATGSVGCVALVAVPAGVFLALCAMPVWKAGAPPLVYGALAIGGVAMAALAVVAVAIAAVMRRRP